MSRSWSCWHTKLFSSALLLPIPASSLSYCIFMAVIALTFAGNTCLMKVWFCICIGFSELSKPTMCNVSPSHFLHHFVCIAFYEQSTVHISFYLRFAILWVNWSIKEFNICFTNKEFYALPCLFYFLIYQEFGKLGSLIKFTSFILTVRGLGQHFAVCLSIWITLPPS